MDTNNMTTEQAIERAKELDNRINDLNDRINDLEKLIHSVRLEREDLNELLLGDYVICIKEYGDTARYFYLFRNTTEDKITELINNEDKFSELLADVEDNDSYDCFYFMLDGNSCDRLVFIDAANICRFENMVPSNIKDYKYSRLKNAERLMNSLYDCKKEIWSKFKNPQFDDPGSQHCFVNFEYLLDK